MFGVVRLEITTAASQEKEATLNVISIAEADLLKDAIFRFQSGRLPVTEATPETPEPEGTLLELPVGDLVLGALTSRLVATIFAVIGALIYFTLVVTAGGFLSDWGENVTSWEEHVIPEPQGWLKVLLTPLEWDNTLVGSLLLILGGLGISLARFVIQYYGFNLTESGDILTKRHGLLTLQTNSLARDRVQAIKVEESLLRRWFGLASVWADSGGDRTKQEDAKKRDPLVPVTSRQEAYSLVKDILVDLPDAEPQWRRVSIKAIARGTRVGSLLLLLIIVQSCIALGWLGLFWLPGFPLIYYLNVKWYQNRGYWITKDYLISRKGWFNRETLYLPVRNLQNMTLRQNYFDRRLELGTLAADTAGQANTGGGPSIRNLPIADARSFQLQLAQRVAELGPFTAVRRGS
jgi:putative membrane protein